MTFRYEAFTTDSERGVLTCRYLVNGRGFEERITLPPGPRWNAPAAQAAARMVFLMAGVSYYKTAAPGTIDLGDTALTDAERAFLRGFYIHGLAEFAHRNALTLAPRVTAPRAMNVPSGGGGGRPGTRRRALVPFGGGIDSIVTVEQVRRLADVALFVVSRPGDRYDAIERPAAVSGLPVIRAEREIDPQLLDPANGFLNGHVPVTGIISAIAVLAAVLDDREAVVMSNEWSASIPTLVANGKPVNHQWSKSAEFERGFRGVNATGTEYFSWLRDRTELWVGREFAELTQYHGTFRSCNKAFYADPARRLDHWCGECDKCCFIDLILAPFVPAGDLAKIFAPSIEPLRNAGLKPKFRALLGAGAKPFECVGEVNECRAGDTLLQDLASETRAWPDAPAEDEIAAMLRPAGESFVPDSYR